MKRNQVAASLTIAVTIFAGSTAFAAGPTNAEYFPFQETASATAASKTSSTAATKASTTTDAKTMGAPAATPADRSAEILMYLKAGS